MDSPVINTISLCTGIGMLDEAFRLGCDYFGWRTRSALCCEWEGYAASCLMARMEESSVEPAPIWCGHLRDLDFSQFLGGVDAILAGFPCQPFSVAGQQRGHEDERNIWDDIIRAITQTEPTIILLENVPGLASTPTIHHRPDLLAHLAALDSAIESAANGRDKWNGGCHRRRLYQRLLREQGVPALLYVKGSLEALGYVVEDPIFVTAESVEASHRRERVFIMAYRKSGRLRELWKSSRSNGFTDGSDQELANDSTLQRSAIEWSEPDGNAGTVADAGRTSIRNWHVARESGRADRPTQENHSGTSSTVDHTGSIREVNASGTVQRQREQQSGRASESSGRCEPVEYTTGECQRESPNDTDAKPATRNSRDESGDGSIQPVGSPTGCSGRLNQPERGSDRRTATGRSGEAMGDSQCSRASTDTARRGSRNSTGESDRSLADADPAGVGQADTCCKGQQERSGERGDIESQLTSAERSGSAIFAPGPGADWAVIPEHLWPAVEPGFRVLVDGVAVVLDQGRTDQLRCGGNGVVPLAAAVAFVELMRRAQARD